MENYNNKILNEVKALREVFWENKNKLSAEEALNKVHIQFDDMVDAEKRLLRFAPLIKKLFNETEAENGIIESPIVSANNLKEELERLYHKNISGKVILKCDNNLKVAGSIKARGGIYEVLKHAEEIAIQSGKLSLDDDYSILSEPDFKKLFQNYKIAVGSTGNLGMSIGIMSAALGLQVYVHMSADAKQWKKNLLRSRGVTVIEYEDDYSKAVEEGRKQCENDPNMYFIDDENSESLFLGYSVAAFRLKKQLEEMEIKISNQNNLKVYLPCGVGGAPGGIAFGLKQIYGDDVKCYFVEPTQAPCMLVGLLTQKFGKSSIKDIGIELKTEADGLAVGVPSGLVSSIADKLIDGIYTVKDEELFKLLVAAKDSENIKIEPSAASSIKGPVINPYQNKDDIHICWLTGGLFVPDDIYENMYKAHSKN